MRLELACVILGAILLARGDARPQQIETNETAIPETKKEIVHGIIDDAKKEQVRSRYRSSPINAQTINNNNNNIFYYNDNLTSGIISRNEKSSRRSKLPQNWTIKSSNNSTKLQNNNNNNNNNIKLLENNYSGFKTEKINLRNIAKISIINNDDELPFNYKKINTKNSNQKISVIKTTTTTTTTRAPTVVKNLVVIRPVTFSSSSSFFDSNKRPPPMKNFIKINTNSSGLVEKPEVTSSHLKNWPNEPLNTIQDFINYEKYTQLEDSLTKKPLKTTTTTTHKPIKQNNKNKYPTEKNKVTSYREPLSHPNVQEIIQWLQIPPFAPINNQSTISQDFKPGESFSNAFEPGFDHQSFVTEKNLLSGIDPTEEFPPDASIPEDGLDLTTLTPSTLPPPIDSNPPPPEATNPEPEPHQKRPIFRPISEVSQNTVVHIINPLPKNPNTSPETDNPSTQKPPPNVHIMFAPSKNNSHEEQEGAPKDPSSKFNQTDCPTIMINSITKINNTIQSKEGCTDLNIIINSQVLSTNNFDGPGFDETGTDKLSNLTGDNTDSTSLNSPNGEDPPDIESVENNYPNKHFGHWGESSSVEPALESSQPPAEPVEPEQPEQVIAEESNESNESPFDVNQETDIEYVAADSSEAEFSDGGTAGQSISGAGGSGPGSIASNLPSIGNPIAGLAGGGPAGGPGDSTALTTVNAGDDDDDDDDDDEDDIFGLTSSSLLDGVTSIFTYLTVLNPLNYGIFSVAAAPFAALAAGVLGVGAMIFPWAFSSGFDFGRASDRVTIRFTPNVEEVVRQSVYDYRNNWGEWKSRRKKSKRR